MPPFRRGWVRWAASVGRLCGNVSRVQIVVGHWTYERPPLTDCCVFDEADDMLLRLEAEGDILLDADAYRGIGVFSI